MMAKLKSFLLDLTARLKKLIRYVWYELKDVKTIILFVCVALVVYSPVWVCSLMYLVFKWGWCLTVATGCLLFWAGPFTPFFPLCIAITLGIKKFMRKK